MKVQYVVKSDVGTYKKTNQDSVLFEHASFKGKDIILGVVCDGVGGLDKGELASKTVIECFQSWFENELKNNLDIQDILNEWKHLIIDVNNRLIEYGKKYRIQLATTLSALLILDESVLLFHVGDSRIYLINEKIKQLSIDHTLVQKEIDQGILSNEEALMDPRRHILYQCIGVNEGIHPQIELSSLQSGTYLLCTDGFYNTLIKDEFLEFNQYHSKRKLNSYVNDLFNRIKCRDEKDNISVIGIQFENRKFK